MSAQTIDGLVHSLFCFNIGDFVLHLWTLKCHWYSFPTCSIQLLCQEKPPPPTYCIGLGENSNSIFGFWCWLPYKQLVAYTFINLTPCRVARWHCLLFGIFQLLFALLICLPKEATAAAVAQWRHEGQRAVAMSTCLLAHCATPIPHKTSLLDACCCKTPFMLALI